MSILHEGFNASLSKGTFGDGCYFAEDPVARIRGLRFVFRSACCACKGLYVEAIPGFDDRLPRKSQSSQGHASNHDLARRRLTNTLGLIQKTTGSKSFASGSGETDHIQAHSWGVVGILSFKNRRCDVRATRLSGAVVLKLQTRCTGGDIFYCFVARVICGATFQTEGRGPLSCVKQFSSYIALDPPGQSHVSFTIGRPGSQLPAQGCHHWCGSVCYEGGKGIGPHPRLGTDG